MTTSSALLISSAPAAASFLAEPHDDPDLLVELFGAFEGVFSPSIRLEALLMAHVKRTHMKDVQYAYQARWWDYRRLPLGHSFMLFAREFFKAQRMAARIGLGKIGPIRFQGKTIADEQTKRRFRGLHGAIASETTERDIWDKEKSYIAKMFKAMVAADMFGIPYDAWCRLGFRTAGDLKWDRMPGPQHLYSDKLAAMTINEWELELSQRLRLASHPMYLAENYQGWKIQDDYYEWVRKAIERSARDVAIPLSIACFDKRQLPLELATQWFGEQQMKRARSLA